MADFDKISINATYYNVKDTAARQQIAEETEAREAADTALGQKITKETDAREQADNQLSQQIESVISNSSSINFAHCVFVGDSYAALSPSWCDTLAGLLPGLDSYHKFANGGGGYQTSGSLGTFTQMFNAGGAVYQDAQSYKDNVTFVIIQGGINDGETTGSDQTNAVMGAVNAAKSLFPNAKICCVYNWFSHAYPEAQWRGILEGGTKAGALVCVDSRVWLWSKDPADFFESDNVHPNAAGTEFASKMLARWLLSGNGDWALPMQSITLSTGLWILFEVNTQVITVHVYGEVKTPVTTTNLGTVPLCLRPYQRDINMLWFDTSMSSSEIATRGPNRIKWGPSGQISTNGNPGSSAISSAATLVIPTDTLFNFV